MEHMEVSCAVWPIYGSLGAKWLNKLCNIPYYTYVYTYTIHFSYVTVMLVLRNIWSEIFNIHRTCHMCENYNLCVCARARALVHIIALRDHCHIHMFLYFQYKGIRYCTLHARLYASVVIFLCAEEINYLKPTVNFYVHQV
jgi:hypothetical protein